MYAIFLGSGTKINLQQKETVISKVDQVLSSNIINKNDIVCISIGEPDCRYQLGYKWHPHYENLKTKKFRIVKPKINRPYIDQLIKNYTEILDKIYSKHKKPMYILSSTGSYPSVAKPLLLFNELMKSECEKREHLIYIDLFSKILNNGKVDDKYIASEGLHVDAIHVNSHISEVLLDELVELDIIKDKNAFDMTTEIFDSLEVKSKFKKDPRFGSYILTAR